MKKQIFRTFTLLCAIALGSLCSSYARTYCNYTCNEFKKDGAFVTLTWTTAANGDVVIYIGKGEGAFSAEFRNGGFEGGLDNGFSVLSGDGFATVVPASTYFTRNGNGLSSDNLVFTLNKKADVDLPDPCQIKFHTEAFSWKANGKDYWVKPYVMTYDYNSAACDQLAAPTDVAITQDGKLTFTGVQGAAWYEARLYFNGDQKYSQVVTSGSTITYTPLVSGTYQVKVVALGYDILNSAESAGADWELTAQEIEVGPSEYCSYPLFSNTNKAATFTWETTEDGDVVITIGASTAGEAFYRGNGFCDTSLDRFTVGAGKSPASNYFERVYDGTGSSTYTLKLKNGVTPPVKGEKINFEGKTVEWQTEKDNNAYDNLTFIYTYGSVCQSLDAPTDVAVSTDSVITFTASTGATSYEAFVYLASTMMYKQTVASGDVLHFFPLKDGNYSVTVVAKAEGMANSEESAPYVWTLTKREVILPNSEYCGKVMGSGKSQAQFTWVTLDNGNVEVTLAEPDGTVDAVKTVFRSTAINLANLKVGKAAMSDYFTSSYTNNVQTFSLINPDNAPGLGEKITYNAMVTYKVVNDQDAWPTYQFDYTYGATCAKKAVSASVNDANMGTATATVDGVAVTAVEEGTEVTFTAIPKDATIAFVNWTKNGVEVSTNLVYTVEVNENTNLTANFDYIRETYCHSAVKATNVDKTLYLTLAATDTENEYMIRIDGSVEAPLTGITSAEFKINNITVDWSEIHTDVVFTAEHWTFDATGYGAATTTFALQEGKTLNDLHVWNRNIKFTSTAGDIEYSPGNDKFPDRYHIAWNTACSDDEAPIMDAPKAEALNTTDIRLTLKATDNWEGPITYTISREGAENIVVTAASGETKTYDVTGLATDATYTFSVVATDTKGNSCTAQECSVTLSAGGDVTAPTEVTVTARPLTDKSIELTLFANDDYDGNITYTITSAPSVSIDNVVAPRGTSTKTVVHTLAANTKYTFSVVATDAAGNAAAAVSTSAITFSGNLALNKPTIVGAGDNISFSNDGDTGTRWGSSNNDSHPAKDWWSVNLGAVYDIQNIRIIWEQARPKFYDILVSNDGINWTVAQSYNQLPEYIQNVKTIVDYPITATGRYIKVAATSTEGGYDNLNWGISIWEFEAYGTPAVDTEAPVITEFVANGASATSILVRATATDNFCGDLSYTFYCDNVAIATPVLKPAGTEATYVFNNLENKEYTFKVVVSDGTNETTSAEVTASPVADDDQAPTGLAVSNIVPEYNRVTFGLSATDNNGGMITYIVKNGDTQVATADALSGATANIVVESLDYLTDYAFTATAQDATGNVSEPINIEFTTTAPPFPLEAAPAPRTYPEALVRPIYSDAFPNILAHDFLKTTWVTIGVEERTIDEDKFLFYTVTEVAHATAWGENGDGANAIIALEEYNDGTNKGVDIRQMNMLHVDLWSIVACQNVELRVCDALVATVQLDGTGWNSFDIDISSLSDDVKTNVRWVKFDRFTEANTFAIDNFFFYQKYDITLDEAQDNATTISINAGKYADVTLNRAFDVDGFNYTLCLPFDLSENQMQEAFGTDYRLWKLDDAYMKSAEVLYLDFKEVRDLEAGVPYIFLPSQSFAAGGILSGVTIKNELHPVEIEVPSFGSVSMTGIYSPYELPVVNNYVLGDDNWLYQSDGNQMLGLRCYFTFGSGVSNVRARAVFHNTDVVTDLETIDGSQCTMHDGKYIYKGRFVIIRNGKQYNAMGLMD